MALPPYSTQLQQVDLEKVVRPFANTLGQPSRSRIFGEDAQPAPVSTTTTTEPEPFPRVSWSARTGVETTDLPSLSVNLKDDRNDTEGINGEINRLTHSLRVFGDDPANYVDIEVVDQIQFTNQSQQKRTYNFNNEQ